LFSKYQSILLIIIHDDNTAIPEKGRKYSIPFIIEVSYSIL